MSWIVLHHIFDCGLMYQFWMKAYIVINCGKLDQSADHGEGSSVTQILVPYDSLGDAFRLRFDSAFFLEEIEDEEASVELKGHQCGGDVGIRGADVMEEAGKEIRLVESRGEPGWEGVGGDGDSVVIDPHAMIERLHGQLLLCVLHHSL